MKKLLAILLSALMLLSAFAAAEGGSVTLGNVQVSANGEMLLDLSGLELVLAAAESDAGLGLRLALNYGAGSADEAVVWLGGTELALKASFLSDAYFMDVGALAGEVEEGFSPEVVEDVASQLSEEDVAAAQAIVAAAAEVLQAGVTDGGETEIDGARYAVTEVDIPEAETEKVMDAVFALLDNHPELLEDSEFSSFGELRQAVDPRLSAAGRICTGEAGTLVDLTLKVATNLLPEPVSLGLYLDQKAGEVEGERRAHIELSLGAAGQSGTLALDVTLAKDNGAWIPAQIGDAMDVLDVANDSAQQQKLMREASAFAMRLLSNVTYILQQNAAAA